ncbi:MAG: TonB-dependent receptor [Bacteroidia bacterium]|nr:TonB-dependent receptor [Bacteroidia bacterium]
MKSILVLWSLLLPFSLMAQFTLTGTVKADYSAESLSAVEVRILQLEKLAITREDGSYYFSDLPSGNYTIQVRKDNFQSIEQSLNLVEDSRLDFELIATKTITEEVIITSLRASEKTATTYTDISKDEIRKENFGQDIPFLLDQVPGTVVNSDAGAGIGYTGIRIRGSDASRTNVTINGVPLNDPESHGVFWVNTPDLSSSINNIQVQRGVGTSTNGAGAFGASINIQTNTLNYEPYAELSNSYGSFNSWKNTVEAGTGLINDKFALDLRLSNITSDGWVDRASSDLKSFFVSGGIYGKKNFLKFNIFSGREITYQSWWGTEESLLDDPETRNSNFYTYENEVDNYRQTHYQLHFGQEINPELNFNASLHYTKGQGYFEQFREEDDFADYPNIGFSQAVFNGDTLSTTDLIRRRWLDNDLFGMIYSLNYSPQSNFQLSIGGAANQYDGAHFGEVIWARFSGDSEIRGRYYDNDARKRDFNTYAKAILQLNPKLSAYVDLQIRNIDYVWGDESLERPGIDSDLREIQGDQNFTFFNPKAGLTYQLSEKSNVYISYSVANREPVRNDFIDAPEGTIPEAETLYDLELGYRFGGKKASFEAVGYYMDYDNQLVLTGELNDVGSNIRQNVKDSYRAGLELVGSVLLAPTFRVSANLALSQNKIKNFAEVLYNYDPFEVIVNDFENTDISFSPNVIGGATLTYMPVKNMEINLISKYVGQQFLDNTSNENRAIDAFFINDLRINYSFKTKWAKEVRLGLLVNNLFDVQYEPNGYTFSFFLGQELNTFNYYYPQAGTNALFNVALRF